MHAIQITKNSLQSNPKVFEITHQEKAVSPNSTMIRSVNVVVICTNVGLKETRQLAAMKLVQLSVTSAHVKRLSKNMLHDEAALLQPYNIDRGFKLSNIF